jgi:hypothetical protein
MQNLDVLSLGELMKVLAGLLFALLLVASALIVGSYLVLRLESEKSLILLRLLNEMPRDSLMEAAKALGAPIDSELAETLAGGEGSIASGSAVFYSFGSHYVVIHEEGAAVRVNIEKLEFQ